MKKGISLIVLVITIIVMIILAASVVITLSNTGVIDRAGQAVDLTNEKQISDFAALVWSDAFMDGERTQSGLESAVINALTTNGVNTNTLDINVTTSGVSVAKKKIYTADEIAADSNIFAVGKTTANNIIAIYNPDTKTLTIKNNNMEGDKIMKDATYSTSIFSTLKSTVEHVVFENGVENVSNYLFRTFTALKSLTLSSGVKSIGYYAFDGCTALSNVKLSSNLNEIKYWAFDGCTSLTEITIPASVTTMGQNAVPGKTTKIFFEPGFDITQETINPSAFASYSYSSAGAMSGYDFAVRYGDGTSKTVPYSFSCSSGGSITDYGYATNVTINGKTRQMDYHYKEYNGTCNY